MAQGDLTMFDEFLVILHEDDANGQRIDLEGDTFKMSLVKAATTPAANNPVPAYSGGTTNFNAAAEVDAGGNYTDGGAVLANPTSTEVGGVLTWDVTDPATWASDASNPTDAGWAIIYDDTTTIKHAICFIDLGATFDMTTGDLDINMAAGGVFQTSIQASV